MVYHRIMNALDLETAILSDDGKALIILDQTLLPNRIEYLHLTKKEEIWEAINKLRVRGAPAIGVAAAYGLYVVARDFQTSDNASFIASLKEVASYLDTSRPTAVNLSWALKRMVRKAEENAEKNVDEIKDILRKEADGIRAEDIAISRSIGEYGFSLLRPGSGILTHCNAGTLATAKYGTALAPVYIALEHGWKDLRVYCDETRPLLQGARLSAFEMQHAGVETYLQCDNMVSYTLSKGLVDIIFVGADRVARNGDFANKIGTSGVAIIAKHYGIPFYCCAPSSSIDMSLASGSLIPIEERNGDEVTTMWYRERMAPEGVKVVNPAFDVTDHSLVTGIITEKGIAYHPFGEAFTAMGIV